MTLFVYVARCLLSDALSRSPSSDLRPVTSELLAASVGAWEAAGVEADHVRRPLFCSTTSYVIQWGRGTWATRPLCELAHWRRRLISNSKRCARNARRILCFQRRAKAAFRMRSAQNHLPAPRTGGARSALQHRRSAISHPRTHDRALSVRTKQNPSTASDFVAADRSL